jgi:DNA helicase-2/ATP-dependent DNA helicase PcrA
MLRRRLGRRDLIPGLSVHQAKGCEWPRVGVALRDSDIGILAAGLRQLEPEHNVLYVALTRARHVCGRLTGADQIELDLNDTADASGV